MLKCKSTGLVLDERLYTGSATPPDSFADRSRWGNNGVHTAITWVRLPSGLWVRSFNGTTSIVTIPHSSSLNTPNGITIEVWFKTSVATEQYIATKGEDSFYLATWGKFRLFLSGLGGAAWLVGTTDVNTGKWVHGVATWVTGAKQLYVNGALDGSSAEAGTMNIGTSNVIIGDRPLLALKFTGSISLVRIYSYALSPAQIRARFSATRHWYGV